MIESYNEYIKKYIIEIGNQALPGEHHFLAVLIAPLIFKLTNNIPLYINPDGTKYLSGDLIYPEKKIAFEAKYNKISFTKTQWDSWIKDKDSKYEFDNSICPKYFIGICRNALIIMNWNKFIEKYKELLKGDKEINPDNIIPNPYTPSISMNNFIKKYRNVLLPNEYFEYTDNNTQINKYENALATRFKEIFA